MQIQHIFYHYLKPFLLLLLCFVMPVITAFSQNEWKIIDGPELFENSKKLNISWSGGINTAQISAANLDTDTVKELFFFDKVAQRVFYFKKIDLGWKTSFFSTQLPIKDWALLRDYNCDDIPDLFTGDVGGILVFDGAYRNGELVFETSGIKLQSLYKLSSQQIRANIFVNPIDVPVIDDIDGDGDIDIIAFSSSGNRAEFHKNFSAERGNVCGFDFEVATGCFGYFTEGGEDASLQLGVEKCPLTIVSEVATKHSGTTLYWNKTNKQLFLGELEYDSLLIIDTQKSISNLDSAIAYQTFPKNNSLGKKEFLAAFEMREAASEYMVVAANATSGFSTENPLQRYQMLDNGNWVLEDANFLGNEMFDAGKETKLTEVSIGDSSFVLCLSTVENSSESYAQFSLLLAASANWKVMDASCLRAIAMQYKPYSLAFSRNSSRLYFSSNTGTIYAAPLQTGACLFDVASVEKLDGIPESQDAHIAITDVNRDGLDDVILGHRNGEVALFVANANGGFTEISTAWSQIKSQLGYNFNTFPKPSIQAINGNKQLWLSLNNGVAVAFQLQNSSPYIDVVPKKEIPYSQKVGRDFDLLFRDNEVLIALQSGGILFADASNLHLDGENEIVVYPNPTEGIVRVNTGNYQARLLNLNGEIVGKSQLLSAEEAIHFDVAAGLYFIELEHESGEKTTHKIVFY